MRAPQKRAPGTATIINIANLTTTQNMNIQAMIMENTIMVGISMEGTITAPRDSCP